AVYEAVWGAPLHAGNFHRKVLSVPGFVESTGETGSRPGSRGGPRARLYRAGDARLLHPALLRPDREAAVR
ncbi:MAG: DNA hydrolase, partial [Actinomycetia bacterium]|nr:DNA hydrolase [Actinomycetes bacterium]